MSLVDRKRSDFDYGGETVLHSEIYLRIETCIRRKMRSRLAIWQSNERTFFVNRRGCNSTCVHTRIVVSKRTRWPCGDNTQYFGSVDCLSGPSLILEISVRRGQNTKDFGFFSVPSSSRSPCFCGVGVCGSGVAFDWCGRVWALCVWAGCFLAVVAGSVLAGCVLVGCVLAGCVLAGCAVELCVWTGCAWTGCDWSGRAWVLCFSGSELGGLGVCVCVGALCVRWWFLV